MFLGLFALLAAAGWLAARVTRALAARQPAPPPAPGRPVSPVSPGQPVPPGQPGGLMGWVARALPFTTVAVAAVMPLAAGLYLLTTTAWAVAERMVLGRRIVCRPASHDG